MKKLSIVLFIYFFGTLISCCNDDNTITYNTIEFANVSLFSFDDNGIFPYFEAYNPNELGIGVYADSISTRTEMASHFSTMDKAYAFENPNKEIYTNTIDSLNVITIYNFDINHPAGSSVNDILLYLNDFGETSEYNINQASAVSHFYKFAVVPENDSLQFKISGRIINKSHFIKNTELVILR
ncbi:hypothetical protein [Formosa sp. PL04]|uniref:hypothetical protein n=1 Tax=Formosa sp. PL04 TaxID=3081755 RepID=UPI002981670A|nr:hypothetical protein [Formosa sp. PL04]MDW5290573.1 hypothetical protein [Formosa sp. PL04]